VVSIKTFGIVLKGTNFGEADKILTILTDRLGKVRAMARGVRKIKSHLAGSLEPYMIVNLQLYEGKSFYTVTGSAIEEDFPAIHKNLKKSAKAFFVGELVDRFVKEDESVREVFHLLSSVLSVIEDSDRYLLILAFELKIIELAGFKPELFNCLHCKEKIQAGQNFWDKIEGGVICSNCQNKTHHGQAVLDGTIKLLRFLEKNSWEETKLLKVSAQIEKETEKILADYIRHILERELKSERFLKMI